MDLGFPGRRRVAQGVWPVGNVEHARCRHHDDAVPLKLNGGRYVDRVEKRDGEWKIAARMSVNEWVEHATPEQLAKAARRGVQQSTDDVSYQRPLMIRQR